MYVSRELEAGALVNLVYVSHSPPNTFTFQYFDDSAELTSLMANIQNYVASDMPPSSPCIMEGCPVLAKCSRDSLWKRGQVISCQEDETAEVYFVDYGNSGFISHSEVTSIPQEFAVLCKQTVTCQVSNDTCVANWSDEHLEAFEELTKSSECMTATVVRSSDIDVIVSFMNTCPDWANYFQSSSSGHVM